MSIVIPINFAAVALNFVHELDPDPWVITWGIDTSDTGAATEVEILEHVALSWSGSFMGYMDSQVTLQTVSGRFGQDGDPLTVEVNSGLVGASASDKLPQNCALMIRKFTSLGGRRGKGRFFIPGIISRNQATETGAIDSALITAATTGCTALLDYLNGTGALFATPMVVLHNSEGSQPVPAPSPVTALSPDPLLSTQRRRLR